MSDINYDSPRDAISLILPPRIRRYREYWATITPTTTTEVYQRWLFAFASVHTTWRKNVDLYQAVKDRQAWAGDRAKLLKLITDSRAGMQNVRTRFIWEFDQKFWSDPIWFYGPKTKSWADYRNQLVTEILGLGQTKVSFALEMCFPTECEVVCLDTHMLQLYGLTGNQSVSPKLYAQMETHWATTCLKNLTPPVLARHIFWDKKQGYDLTNYWSYVFEN